MRAEGRWLQTYWGGAAIVLVMDVALRRCGDTSIDDVVAALRAEQPRVDARRVAALDIVARAAAVSPACATLQDDVEAMLDEPFPGAARPLLEALATGPTDPSLAAVAGAILSPGAAAAGAGCGGRRMSGP
jgi:predicted metalloprotease with PDZ domain